MVFFRHYDPQDDVSKNPGESCAEKGQDQKKDPHQGGVPAQPFSKSGTDTGNDPVAGPGKSVLVHSICLSGINKYINSFAIKVP